MAKVIRQKKRKNVKNKKTPKGSKQKSGKKKRKTISGAMYAFFDSKGVDKVTYEECLKLAKSILPSTKFNKYHFSWYKNKYEQRENE